MEISVYFSDEVFSLRIWGHFILSVLLQSRKQLTTLLSVVPAGNLIGLLQKFGITCTLRLHFVILSPLFLMQTKGAFICTFSLLISISIPLWTSKFWNRFTISSKYFDMACYIKRETYSGPISGPIQVQQNDILTDNVQSFETPFYFYSIGN